MKQVIILSLAILFFGACNTKVKKENESLKAEIDSLSDLSSMKDSAITYFIESMNDIERNLEIIKEKESIITLNASGYDIENNSSQQDKINEDIQLIYNLLGENQQTVDNLNEKFKKANLKIKAFEETIAKLTKEIEKRNREINTLKDELIAMNIQIETLTVQAENLVAESEEKDEIIEQQTDELNSAYYVFGSEKELKENQIITKEGGFIGLGKIEKLKDNFNKDYFTKIDIREKTTIGLYCKKAKVITTHPSDSYKLTGEEAIDAIEIIDPDEFWKASKYLVVVVD
jgi:chromosome segregation ATPase